MRVLAKMAGACLMGLALLAGTAQAAVTLPGGFERTLASGLSQPTQVAWAPGGRMFIATKPGVVYYADPPDPAVHQLLDISSHVNTYHDRGLLGIAVDSNFASNHFLWLLYVYEPDPANTGDTSPKTSRLSRVTVQGNGTAGPETVVLGTNSTGPCPAPADTSDCIPVDEASHAIGTVRSASDGTLWVGTGDGASFNFVDQRALRTYDEHSLAGKILHVDRSGRGLSGHPFCPPSGPTEDLGNVCTKVYAKGFRNPFRFSLRPFGGPIVGDVGWNTTEELDLLSPGRNYGWPCYEAGAGTSYGVHTPGYKDLAECSAIYSLEGTSQAATPPDYDFPHNGSSASVVGGPLYPGGGYPPELTGKIFFGNFSSGTISAYDAGSGTASSFASGIKVVDLELAPDGNLAYVDIVAGAVGEIAFPPPQSAPGGVTAPSPSGAGPPAATLLGGAQAPALLSPSATATTRAAGKCRTARRSHHRRVRSAGVRCVKKPKKRRTQRQRET